MIVVASTFSNNSLTELHVATYRSNHNNSCSSCCCYADDAQLRTSYYLTTCWLHNFKSTKNCLFCLSSSAEIGW